MIKEFKPENAELIPSKNSSLAIKRSGLVKRGLELLQEKKQVRVLIGNFTDNINDILAEIIKSKYNSKIQISFFGEEILKLAENDAIDIFILIVNNIRFYNVDSVQDRLTKSLKLIDRIKSTYGRPVIALSSLKHRFS